MAEVTIRTPQLVGHIIRERHFSSETPTFIGETIALCGAQVKGRVDKRRYVCGKCVALLIEDRNNVNRELDLAEARLAIIGDTLDQVLDRIGPDNTEPIQGDDEVVYTEAGVADGDRDVADPPDTEAWTPPTDPGSDPAR